MGGKVGRWVAETPPNKMDYPFEIAARLIRDPRSCTHNEVCELVTITRKFYELCKEQDETIRRLERELAVAESTVRLLQVQN